MSNNINSFVDNVNQLVKSTNSAVSILNGISESFVGTSDTVDISVDGSTFSIPSYSSVINKVNTMNNTMAAFTSGNGIVETTDNTYRKIQVTPIPIAPTKLTDLGTPTTFNISSNWMFESLMFPKLNVKIDLTDKIDKTSDRVYVNRIIIDMNGYSSTTNSLYYNFFKNNIMGSTYSYNDMVKLLSINNISYWEDKEIVDLPLTYNKYIGTFNIVSTSLVDNVMWYYLDTISYGLINADSYVISNNYSLNIGDKIRYGNSLFNITNVDIAQKAVVVEPVLGLDSPAISNDFYFYNEPYSEQYVNIAIGYNEGDIIYIKGVNENYNLLANDWSNPISFVTNELLLENSTVTLKDYYYSSVADFGADWLEQAKEKKINSYSGITPNTPVLNADDLKVVQINTQINASLDTASVNNLSSQIVKTNSNITELREKIAAEKNTLVTTKYTATTNSARETLISQIGADTKLLSTLVSEYSSYVQQLNSIAAETGALNYSPKYHVRGFFPIPEPQYITSTDASTVTILETQEVIGFDIRYRYTRLDDTGVSLNTFNYTDADGNIKSATFSDWNLIEGVTKEKIYDASLGVYIWKAENDSDGNEININQIDLAISEGEKLEIVVRSISEAGYPANPCKSPWSDSIIIEFPSNLSSDDQLTNILESAKGETINILLNTTISSLGLIAHISDMTFVNDTSTYYKHNTENIAYEDNVGNDNDPIYMTIPLNKKIKELENRIASLETSVGSL